MSWPLKYRPKSLEEVINQEDVKSALREWMESWVKGKPQSKAVMLYGRPGAGKTTLAEALARDYQLELLEMNASDSRNLKDVRRIAEVGATQGSLFGVRGKLILMDEVDGVNAKADYGAIQAILELISNSKHPIVLTANDPWDPSLRELRNVVKMIEVKPLGKTALKKILRKVCEKEKLKCGEGALDFIAEISEGDARYAINSLQAIAQGYGEVNEETAKLILRRKEREYDPFETLRGIFWARYAWQAKEAVSSSHVDYEMLIRWISENIPVQMEGIEDIWRAYDALSRASIFLKRAKLSGWDLLTYTFDLMGPGVAMAEKGKSKGTWKAKWKKFQFPQYIQLMSKSRENRQVRDSILSKLGKATHTSYNKTLVDTLPFVRVLIERETDIGLALSQEELEYLKGEEKGSTSEARPYSRKRPRGKRS